MKKIMIKEKQFRLILREPGRGDKILAEGSEEFVAKQRTKLSLEHNPDFLKIEEVKEEDDSDLSEVGMPGIIISLVLSLIILGIYGKKRK